MFVLLLFANSDAAYFVTFLRVNKNRDIRFVALNRPIKGRHKDRCCQKKLYGSHSAKRCSVQGILQAVCVYVMFMLYYLYYCWCVYLLGKSQTALS